MSSLTEVLKQYWGYDSFRPLQAEAMRAILENRDSVVVLPTGGGKSICFQAPAVAMPGVAVVVSPLISLMKDQVDSLTECGIAAACVNSSMSHSERREVADSVRRGELKLLYVAPERLCSDKMLDFLESSQVSFFAIDEAHCISAWGHDFRPEYRMLQQLRTRFPAIGVHAYTATATEQVRHDMSEQLGLRNPEWLIGSFDRPNLVYRVQRKTDVVKQVRAVIDAHPDESGIVYCISRREVDELAAVLSQAGYKARPYHAGLPDADRVRHQDEFLNEVTQIIVATVAFTLVPPSRSNITSRRRAGRGATGLRRNAGYCGPRPTSSPGGRCKRTCRPRLANWPMTASKGSNNFARASSADTRLSLSISIKLTNGRIATRATSASINSTWSLIL